MSLITDFPFHAYMADLKTRHTVGAKTGLSLSLLTSEDMQEMATVEVRVPAGEEKRSAPWLPVVRNSEALATMYDTRMGNFSIKGFPTQPCSTCAHSRATTSVKLGNERCAGHFGYVSMPRKYPNTPERSERIYVTNPHLAEETEMLLQAKCFFCHRFRAAPFDVERFRLALLLADAGLMAEALNFLEAVANLRGQLARNRRGVRDNENAISTEEVLQSVARRLLERKGVLAKAGSVGAGLANGGSYSGQPPPLLVQEEETEDGEMSVAAIINATQEAIMAQVGAQTGLPSLDLRQEICKQALRELRESSLKCHHCHCWSPAVTSYSGHLFFHFKRANLQDNLKSGALTNDVVAEWTKNNELHNRTRTYFHTTEVREHIKQLFQLEHPLLGLLFPHMGEASIALAFEAPLPPNMLYKVFFLDKVFVPPLPVRLSSGLRLSDSGAIMPDECTRGLSDVLKYVAQIEIFHSLEQHPTNHPTDAQRRANEQNLRNLQVKVAELYTDTLESFAKKEGLFRMNMMGKRVNQACRSVISPDYLVEPNEVLLPRPFARHLTYPEQVSAHSPARTALLKRCVVNGPDVYPGATHLEWRLSSGEVRFVDLHVTEPQRRQHANRYFAMAQTGTLIVHRHVLDGDRLIFNRQPTLHKVSMLGYRAKVLSGLKTLRFHYVNGKSYNADFDGDEMNIHVPQSLETKAELECLMDADLNYLVPTSGKPIRGLIQDHLAAAVLLTTRDKFFDRSTFTQYVFYGLAPYLQRQTLAGAVTLSSLIPIPAILLPVPLWTGKQLVSVMIRFVTGVAESEATAAAAAKAAGGGSNTASAAGLLPGTARRRTGLQLKGTSLIQPNVYTHTDNRTHKLVVPRHGAMDDDKVIIQNSELVAGVVDKNQLGPSNLSVPHVIHEVYGPHVVGTLFGAIGRVLSLSLQREGFSMGMDDMMLVLEDRRSKLLEELDLAPLRMSEQDGGDEAKVMPHLANLATQLQKEFVPGRLLMPFPVNQLLMMTVSGAKGSNTNAIQMALGLGQQLFDGRRVAPMNSGRTLPPFFIGDRRARSFGYAMGRFASGIRPAEYTIHAMAGRDGLIDTAVKTSRSGHLQRCLIKGLESLVVQWDHSVRDANGAVIQFVYGGDGLDPVKASTLQAWEVVKDNATDLAQRYGIDAALGAGDALEDGAGGDAAGEKRRRMDEELAAQMERKKAALLFNAHKNPLPPHIRRSMTQYLEKEADYQLFRKISQVERWAKKGNLAERFAEKRRTSIAFYEDMVGDITTFKRARAFCDAGEPVGLLAAQAAGEPSTQMTLNTFHSAGSTVTHVTEGIPRLRELLIHASVKNAAVIVPVVRATEADEAAISRAMRAGPATKLAECLARDGKSAKGYHYAVERNESGAIYTISLLFSRTALADKQESMCMSHDEHVSYYIRALREFAKRVIRLLSGGTGSGSGSGSKQSEAGEAEAEAEAEDDADRAYGAGLLRRPTRNPAADAEDNDEEEEEAAGATSATSSSSSDSEADDDDAAAERRRRKRAASKKASGEAPRSSKKRRVKDEDDDDDDEDSNSDAGSVSSHESEQEHQPGVKRGRHAGKAVAAPAAEEEEDLYVEDHGGASGGEGYDHFPAIHATLRSGKYRVTLEPSGNKNYAPPHFPADLFVVDVRIATSDPVVAVVPDVLERVLETLEIPSWLPQFESVSFTRQAQDTHSGEMVFQGPNATLDNVLTFLSILTVGLTSGAIQVAKARSTNIHHMVQTLGVESGYRALLDELTKLFKRYAVDYHHLTLIADAATNRGRWESFNFTGIISHSASPLFQMTFASSKRFLHTAVTRGVGDDLRSFSAAIMTGQRPRVGTACTKVLQNPAMLQDIMERQFS
eukprot:gene7602-5363_t